MTNFNLESDLLKDVSLEELVNHGNPENKFSTSIPEYEFNGKIHYKDAIALLAQYLIDKGAQEVSAKIDDKDNKVFISANMGSRDLAEKVHKRIAEYEQQFKGGVKTSLNLNMTEFRNVFGSDKVFWRGYRKEDNLDSYNLIFQHKDDVSTSYPNRVDLKITYEE